MKLTLFTFSVLLKCDTSPTLLLKCHKSGGKINTKKINLNLMKFRRQRMNEDKLSAYFGSSITKVISFVLALWKKINIQAKRLFPKN